MVAFFTVLADAGEFTRVVNADSTNITSATFYLPSSSGAYMDYVVKKVGTNYYENMMFAYTFTDSTDTDTITVQPYGTWDETDWFPVASSTSITSGSGYERYFLSSTYGEVLKFPLLKVRLNLTYTLHDSIDDLKLDAVLYDPKYVPADPRNR